MLEFIIEEIYNISSDKAIIEILNPDYCKFITDKDKNIISYYFENIKFNNNEIETKSYSNLKPIIPNILKNIIFNNGSIEFYEYGKYNLLDNTGTFILKSSVLNNISTKINYSSWFQDLEKNKCKKFLKFQINSEIKPSFLRGVLENIIKKDIIEKSKIRNNYINQWINIKNKN
jgi:hypothetical protein